MNSTAKNLPAVTRQRDDILQAFACVMHGWRWQYRDRKQNWVMTKYKSLINASEESLIAFKNHMFMGLQGPPSFDRPQIRPQNDLPSDRRESRLL